MTHTESMPARYRIPDLLPVLGRQPTIAGYVVCYRIYPARALTSTLRSFTRTVRGCQPADGTLAGEKLTR